MLSKLILAHVIPVQKTHQKGQRLFRQAVGRHDGPEVLSAEAVDHADEPAN